MMAIAHQADVSVQVRFDDGTLLYSSTETPLNYAADMPQGVIVNWSDEDAGISQSVMHTRVEWLNLSLYVAKDKAVIEASLEDIFHSIVRTAVLITIPTLLLVALFSMQLTQSIRKLTRKVQQSPVDRSPRRPRRASVRRCPRPSPPSAIRKFTSWS